METEAAREAEERYKKTKIRKADSRFLESLKADYTVKFAIFVIFYSAVRGK